MADLELDNKSGSAARQIFYGWWIVVAAFLNLFFVVGIIFYGFPVFYPSLVDSLGFTRAELTQGFLLGFVISALLFGVLAGDLGHLGGQAAGRSAQPRRRVRGLDQHRRETASDRTAEPMSRSPGRRRCPPRGCCPQSTGAPPARCCAARPGCWPATPAS